MEQHTAQPDTCPFKPQLLQKFETKVCPITKRNFIHKKIFEKKKASLTDALKNFQPLDYPSKDDMLSIALRGSCQVEEELGGVGVFP